jgi:hypothetical protein
MPSAMIVVVADGPNSATIPMATRMMGIAKKRSTIRVPKMSTIPPT